MKVIKITRQSDPISIFWHLTDFCNFKCSYCPDYCKSGDFAQGRKAGAPTDEEMLGFLDRLDNENLLNGKSLQLVISGGEPTVHSLFGEVVSRCGKYGSVTVNTNGSRPLNWWKNLPALPTGVNISLHFAETKIAKINELAEFLIANNVQVRFNLMCDPTHWDECMALYTGLNESLRPMVMAQVLHDPDAPMNRSMFVYTDEQQEWLRKQNQKLSNYRFVYGSKYSNDDKAVVHFDNGTRKFLPEISETSFKLNGWHKFYNWDCSAGHSSFNINFNGTVWSSICKSVQLGRINDFKLLEQPQKCKHDICIHPYDMALVKSKT